MIQFKTLEGVSSEEIRTTFNEAFREYYVPLHLTQAQLEQKLFVEGYAPELSAGAFEDNQLVGLILHGSGLWNNKLTAYNCGTGVIASHRRQQLSQRMYSFILPELKERGFKQSILEVIQENEKAIHSYQSVGFSKLRELISFKGTPVRTTAEHEMKALPEPDWPLLMSYWSWLPSWQHGPECLGRAAASYTAWGIEKEERVVAYAMINPLTNRIASFAVAPPWRRKGLGSALLFGLQQLYPEKPLVFINIEGQSTETMEFMNKLGFSTFVKQYEMALQIQ